MGRLTKEPEVRYTQTSNIMVTNFILAINRRFVKNSEEKKADFINIVTFGKTAEFVSKYFKKGQQVAVCGRIENRNYQDSKGQKKYVIEVIAEEVYFAEHKKDESLGNAENFQYPEFSNDDDLPF